VKYTPAGTPIEISASVRDAAIEVNVADRGPGFPPGEEGRIFHKFYRLPGAVGAGGVGLGLTICQGMVTAHGGRIWAENRAGGGAVFHFTLPLVGTPPSGVPAESDDG
jgi:two-component system sensor histidine kinase KdpD